MKKAISLFIAATIILLALCSCGAYEMVEASTIFKEYDLDDVNFEDTDQVYQILCDIYNKEFFVSPYDNAFDHIYKSYSIWSLSDDRTDDKCLIVDVYKTAQKAHEDYEEKVLFNIPQDYKYGVVRVNNVLLYNSSILVKDFLHYYGLDGPVVRNIRKDVIKKSYNKEIDVEKLLDEIYKTEYTVYVYESGVYNDAGEQYIDYTVIKTDKMSSLRVLSNEKAINERWFDLNVGPKDTAGTLLQYNNLSFVFLDDFWLDIIKQCEK